MLNDAHQRKSQEKDKIMHHHIMNLADISPLAWVAQGLTQLNVSLLVLGFAGLLLGIMLLDESEDPTDMY
jgi:hypothetical protein